MLFPTLNFGLFFLVVFLGAWLLTRFANVRMIFLVVASYVFYAAWDPRFCLLLFASSAANWFFGRIVYQCKGPVDKKRIVAVAVAINLIVLGFFKYYNFFIESFNEAMHPLSVARDLPYFDILLPVGISFFTFHGISYIVDIYRGKLARPATLLHMLLYISFFPQLVAGPIVRASHFLPQLLAPVDSRDIRATRAFLLILGGLFKKVVIANYLATGMVDDVFFDPSRYGSLDLLLATYGYAIQIYCDFSAYTDIAIGIAALLGYQFPQNFDQPYRALGVRDFWQRWHISLSTWLRDYVYIPFGGNKGGWKRYRNLMLTMLLGGLWHGAAWTFVIWGAMHGALLVVEHLLWPERDAFAHKPRSAQALCIFITFHLICLTWIFFRSPDLHHAFGFLAGFVTPMQAPAAATPFMALLLVMGLATQFLPKNRIEIVERYAARIPMPLQGGIVGAAIIVINSLGPTGVAPFIYFQF